MTTDTTRPLQELADHAAITELLARQGRWLDERRFDETASIFTEDATADTAGGHSEGLEALTAQAERVHTRYDRTQHITSNVLIDLDGDRATVRANLVAVFVGDATTAEPTFTLGEIYNFDAVRTAQGWKFSRVQITPVWRSGQFPANIAATPSTVVA